MLRYITTQLDPLAHIDMSSLSVLHLEPIDSLSQINHVEVNINEFIHNNRVEKEKFHHLRHYIPDTDFSEVYSSINTPVYVDEEHNHRLEHRSIIPDCSNPLMQPKLEQV